MSRAVLGICFALVGAVGALLGLVAGSGGGTLPPAQRSTAAAGPPSFADIVLQVNPAVVHIMVVEGPARAPGAAPHGLPGIAVPRRGEGSGFIVDPEGYILTNQHLVESGARIRVRLADRREVPARLVGSDAHTDLALLKVEARALPTVTLGDSDRLRVGDWVCAIGNPYRFDHTVTVGVVSSKGRKIFDASFDAYIQTDAAINPGNSGGPLINAAGEVVGINSAVSREGQGIGFAVPINVARGILDQLRTRGRVSRGFLGVQLQELDPDLQGLIGLPEPRGAVVLDLVKGGAGEGAGLRRYDAITGVSGQAIDDGDQLVRAIAARPPGSAVTLTVFRDGQELSLEVRLGERDGGVGPPSAEAEEAPGGGDALGLRVTDLSAEMRRDLDIPADRAGVVVRDILGVAPGVEALAHGDLIVEVNRRATPDAASYERALAGLRRGEVAWLFVYRPRPARSFLAKVEVEAGR